MAPDDPRPAGFVLVPAPDLLSAAHDGHLLAVAEGQRPLTAAEREQARRMAEQRAAFLEDLEFMVSTGETTEGAARRFGISPASLHRKLTDPTRVDRPDLWEALRENEIRRFGTTLGDLLGEKVNGHSRRTSRSGVAA